MKQERYEVIDGQQRIDAISEFMTNKFKLLNPKKNSSLFPQFIQKEKTGWRDKYYTMLSNEEKENFTKSTNHIVIIETDNENEIRDLFIRLQGGLPLNAQEKRDAWPGNFRNLILEIGGKKNTEYAGHNFIIKYVQHPKKDRGSLRKISAQLVMTFLEYKNNNGRFLSLKSKSLDSYYHRYIDMDLESEGIILLKKNLDFLYNKFKNYRGKPLKIYEVIDILLLIEDLKEYSFEDNILTSFDNFREELAKARKEKEGEYYNYVINASNNSDAPEVIRERHNFFMRKMFEMLNPTKKDEIRAFTEIDKSILYNKFKQRCVKCLQALNWKDMEIHHIIPYSQGGKTDINNGAPVHKDCHPKTEKEVSAFQEFYNNFHNNPETDFELIFGVINDTEKREFKQLKPNAYIEKHNIEELKNKEFQHWSNPCEHFNIEIGRDSARRRFEKWRQDNRPDWHKAL